MDPKRARSQRPALLTALIAAAFLAGVVLTRLWMARTPAAQPWHVSLLPPRDAEIDSIAASPDGRCIAIAASVAGTPRLYIRAISGSFQPSLLAGTEGASYPFWSPDARSIGFFAGRKLKTIDAIGGEARILADAPLGRGGVWTRRGEIVFAPGALGSLARVSINGGGTVTLTNLNRAQGEVSHLWPALLPDGHRLSFLSQNRDPALDALVAIDLNSPGNRIRVVNANSSAAFSNSAADGLRVLFLRDGALLQQRLADATLNPIGEPVTVAPQVDFDPIARYALFSASAANLVALVPGSPFRYQLQGVDRSGQEIDSVADDGDYYALKLSPDGSHLLTNRTDARTGSTGVWSVDVSRRTVSPVTLGSVDFFPIWSPDSAKVAFARSDGTAERGMRLSVVPANGGSSQVLLDVPGPVFPSDWSSNGSYLAYTGYKPLAQVTVLSISQPNLKEFWSYSSPGHSAGGGVFSPNGPHDAPKWIAYTSDESGRNEVYVQSFPGNGSKVQMSVSGGNTPLWRSDGKELFFVDGAQKLCAVSVTRNSRAFGTPHPSFELSGSLQMAPPYASNYAASRDGQRFLVRRTAEKVERPVVEMIAPSAH